MAPIVLLHGVGLDRAMWGPLLTELDGTVVDAIDLPGHGSRPVLREPQSLASLAADVAERLPRTPVHLVGFSLGALIAQYIARHLPDRIMTLTAVSSVCHRTAEEEAAVENRLATARDGFAGSVNAALDRWFPAEQTTVAAETIADVRRVLERNDVESYLHCYAVFATGDREIAPELGRITQPTLAITGELDPGSTPEMSRRLASEIPGGRVHVVPGARHMLPVEAAPALATELTAFIDEWEGQSS